ncbi:hypothetical protein [Nonomuraea endophytica]|uniref:Uncharacterized protein n=1 Tax=Nonomuraea endophytica TaxID=714136 RepID=A0A7W8A839_9ACTN|nr:hypothetical protein [Nonomuraea endophytica]MBB5081298.1 hypothetical protein [Nonomuraea endophytica]
MPRLVVKVEPFSNRWHVAICRTGVCIFVSPRQVVKVAAEEAAAHHRQWHRANPGKEWTRLPEPVMEWNNDKPHRCPACHTIAVDLDGHPQAGWIYTCCACKTRFADDPGDSLLREAGSCCTEHPAGRPSMPDLRGTS